MPTLSGTTTVGLTFSHLDLISLEAKVVFAISQVYFFLPLLDMPVTPIERLVIIESKDSGLLKKKSIGLFIAKP